MVFIVDAQIFVFRLDLIVHSQLLRERRGLNCSYVRQTCQRCIELFLLNLNLQLNAGIIRFKNLMRKCIFFFNK